MPIAVGQAEVDAEVEMVEGRHAVAVAFPVDHGLIRQVERPGQPQGPWPVRVAVVAGDRQGGGVAGSVHPGQGEARRPAQLPGEDDGDVVPAVVAVGKGASLVELLETPPGPGEGVPGPAGGAAALLLQEQLRPVRPAPPGLHPVLPVVGSRRNRGESSPLPGTRSARSWSCSTPRC